MPTPEEIPSGGKPQGRLVAMYPATQVPLRNAWFIVFVAVVSIAAILGLIALTSSDSWVLPQARDALILSVFAAPFVLIFAAYAIANAAYEWQRWRRRRHEDYAIYEDGLVAQRDGLEVNYLWWFNLRDYRIETRFTYPVALILRMEDGRAYRLDNLFDRVDEIVRTLTDVLRPILVQRTIGRIRAGEAVQFGDLSLNRQGLEIESKNTKRFIEWGKLLSCDIDPRQREVLLWTEEPLSVISADNPVGYRPVLSATINTRQFPNLLAFVEIARKVGQFNRIRTSPNDANAPSQESVTTVLQSESLGLFVQGKRNPRAASAVLNPVRRITEVFRDGMIIHSNEQAQIVLWSDVIQYRIRYRDTIYNLFSSPTLKYRVDVETADGRRWRFNERDSNFGELKQLLTGLPHERLLNRALAELHEQGKVIFGPLTVTQDGLVYRARQLAWEHVSLMDQQYRLLIRRKGRLEAFAAVRLDLVPNYYVLLALISHLQSTHA